MYNKYKSDDEYGISIKDLCAEFIRKLWLILAISLVIAIAVTGYKYISDKRTAEEYAQNIMNGDDAPALTEAEELAVRDYVKLVQNAENTKTYLNNSILMNLNGKAINVCNLQYSIKNISIEQQNKLLSIYRNYLMNGALASAVSTELGDIESEYVQELLTITCDQVINIKIYGSDQESSEKLKNAVMDQMNDSQEVFESEVGKFELNILQDEASVIVDNNVISLQEVRANELNNAITKREGSRGGLSEAQLLQAQKELEDATREGISVNNTQIGTNVETPHISKKYMVAGWALGIIIGMMLVMVCYYFNKSIKRGKDIQNRYQVQYFGNIITAKKNYFESLAEKIFFGKEKAIDDYGLLVNKLVLTCNKKEINEIALVGDFSDKNIQFISKLVEDLADKHVKAKIIGNIAKEQKAVENLADVKNIVFVESLRQTSWEMIREHFIESENHRLELVGYLTISK